MIIEDVLRGIGLGIEDARKIGAEHNKKLWFHFAVAHDIAKYLRETPEPMRPDWCMDGHVHITEDKNAMDGQQFGCMITSSEWFVDVKKEQPSIFANETPEDREKSQ